MPAVAVSEATAFCRCGCGRAVARDPRQNTHRFFATEQCAYRSWARRNGLPDPAIHTTTPNHTQEDGTMKKATKTTKKAGTKRGAAAPTDYTKAKLDVQAQCVIGKSYTYSGINEAFKGKKVTVTGHEGRGGIFIKLGEKTLTCSPFALVGRPDAPKPKAKATQKAALKATKAKAKGKATAVTKAPEAAAPAAQAAPEEATAAPKKARKAA